MANNNFNVSFTQSPGEVLAGAKSAIRGAKGNLEGDTSSGVFKVHVGIGDIEGKYTMSGSMIHIDIIKKPLLVTNKMIEKKLRSYLVPKAA
jgi:hypothetical protein